MSYIFGVAEDATSNILKFGIDLKTQVLDNLDSIPEIDSQVMNSIPYMKDIFGDCGEDQGFYFAPQNLEMYEDYLLHNQVTACDATRSIISTGFGTIRYSASALASNQQLDFDGSTVAISDFQIDLEPIEYLPVEVNDASSAQAFIGSFGSSNFEFNERQNLLNRSQMKGLECKSLASAESDFKISHGTPFDSSLLRTDYSEESLYYLEKLLSQNVVFVASSADIRHYLFANQLTEKSYCILSNSKEILRSTASLPSSNKFLIQKLSKKWGQEILIGAYKVQKDVAPSIFYVRRDLIDKAVAILMQNTLSNPGRPMPLLVDLADYAARKHSGHSYLRSMLQNVLIEEGLGNRLMTERFTRNIN